MGVGEFGMLVIETVTLNIPLPKSLVSWGQQTTTTGEKTDKGKLRAQVKGWHTCLLSKF